MSKNSPTSSVIEVEVEKVKSSLKALGITCAVFALIVLILTLTWNWSMHDGLHLPALSYWQVLCGAVFVNIMTAGCITVGGAVQDMK